MPPPSHHISRDPPFRQRLCQHSHKAHRLQRAVHLACDHPAREGVVFRGNVVREGGLEGRNNREALALVEGELRGEAWWGSGGRGVGEEDEGGGVEGGN